MFLLLVISAVKVRESQKRSVHKCSGKVQLCCKVSKDMLGSCGLSVGGHFLGLKMKIIGGLCLISDIRGKSLGSKRYIVQGLMRENGTGDTLCFVVYCPNRWFKYLLSLSVIYLRIAHHLKARHITTWTQTASSARLNTERSRSQPRFLLLFLPRYNLIVQYSR